MIVRGSGGKKDGYSLGLSPDAPFWAFISTVVTFGWWYLGRSSVLPPQEIAQTWQNWRQRGSLRIGVSTDHEAVAVRIDDEFFAECVYLFHEWFVHDHSKEFSGCGAVDVPRAVFTDSFREEDDFAECVFADGFLLEFCGRGG